MEIWKDVKGYEGLYQVSNTGRVFSARKDGFLKLQNFAGVYKKVILFKNRKGKRHSAHRLVLSAFVPNPQNKPCVNHKDFNPSNNNVHNLEWCTHKENMQHSSRAGRLNGKRALRGMDNANSKLTKLNVMGIRFRLSNGERVIQIAKAFGVSESAIRNIKDGVTWSWFK